MGCHRAGRGAVRRQHRCEHDAAGAAWQRGLIPISADAIDQAIALNGVAIALNRRAFAIGRLLTVDPKRVVATATAQRPTAARHRLSESLDEMIERRAGHLQDYQDERLAQRYTAAIERVREAEAHTLPGSTSLTEAVARNLHRVLANKDEYEVARLYTDGAFAASLAKAFENGGRVSLHLALPLLSRADPATGRPAKRMFGPWIMPLLRGLAAIKGCAARPSTPSAGAASVGANGS